MGNIRLSRSQGSCHSGQGSGVQGESDFSCCFFWKSDFGGLVAIIYPIFVCSVAWE